MSFTLHAVQMKMARAALGLDVGAAARLAGVAESAITTLEAGDEAPQSTLDKIRTAFEAAGVEFIPEGDRGAGVRMWKAPPDPPDIASEDLNASNDE